VEKHRKIDPKNINPNNLGGNFYIEYESGSESLNDRSYRSLHSPNLSFTDNSVEYEFRYAPEYVLATLVDIQTGELLDYRGYHFGWSYQEGITIEREPLDVTEIIRRGESLTVEFKQDLTNKDEFLETVVAFANTNGGIILIGVSDDGRIIGYESKDKNQITNLISSNIEPNPDFKESQIKIDEKFIIIIEIPERRKSTIFTSSIRGLC